MMRAPATSPPGDPPELDALDERDALFIAYLEGDLTDDERAEFRAELDHDAQLRHDFEQFADVMGGMQSLPFEFAPPDFVEQVQGRIRSRSQGRFFADSLLFSSRTPYEAIAVVMIAVMAAAWMLMGKPKDHNLRDVDVQVAPKLETAAGGREPSQQRNRR